MATLKKRIKAALICAGITALIFFAVVLAEPGYARLNADSVKTASGPWLSQYEGQTVRVTFVTVPTYLGTDLQKTSALRIVEAGQAGIVVAFRPSRTVFFPYSQIASIEPIYTNR